LKKKKDFMAQKPVDIVFAKTTSVLSRAAVNKVLIARMIANIRNSKPLRCGCTERFMHG
jgi:hypothetical protein